MEKDSGTRSGMLWEVERILNECAELGRLPQVLIMENVTQVHSKDNMPHFQAWIKALEKLGYSSYWKDLNAKDYGIPQNRDRTFMVSMLGDWYYEFPKKIQLKLRLKDMLEDNVDEKYYLSERTIEQISKWNAQQDPLANAKTEDDDILQCITAKSNTTLNASMLLLKEKIVVGGDKVIIPEATSKGYAEANDGDGIYVNRPHQKRGVVQKGMIQTLKTQCDDVAVVVKVGNYSPSGHNASSIVDTGGIAPTVMENHGTITAIVEENDGK